MTRTVCETCGRYSASKRDWEITEPGEESPEAPPEGLCWAGARWCHVHAETIPRLRVERWLRWWNSRMIEAGQAGDVAAESIAFQCVDTLVTILAGEEPPE